MPSKKRTIRMKRYGKLLLTRERARAVAQELPPSEEYIFDFADVDVASPSYLDQIIRSSFERGSRSITFVNVSKQTKESLDRVKRARAAADLPDLPEVMVG